MTASSGAFVGPAFRRAKTVLVLLAGAVMMVLGTSTSALAHDGLVGTSPATGSTVPAAPRSVELEFTGEPLPLGTVVAVTGPVGDSVSSGATEIRGTTVVQAIAGDPAPGIYRVEWRSTSSDGHPLSGTFEFTVATGSAPAEATSEVSSSAAEPAPAEPVIAPVWLVVGAVVLVGLGPVLVTRVRRHT
ncbi:copper resistance CopC family protein [Candidatus Blastococcus massiliensis]|uniref:copper resistance CopC family protein n=1 Tax=Candidatus Blastococcus massiliensis TaxID=1470358 RepID=UPI0004B9869F|nr:copper resistance protein CopC [Candidatus Blastococcus massiliensis]